MSPNALPVQEPEVTPETAEFWAACAQGRLSLPKCDRCGTFIWYPRAYCPECSSLSASWVDASGRGYVYSFTVVHHSSLDDYQHATPYVIAYVELEEGPRVMTHIVGCEPDDVEIGMPVTVVFVTSDAGAAVYRFEPA